MTIINEFSVTPMPWWGAIILFLLITSVLTFFGWFDDEALAGAIAGVLVSVFLIVVIYGCGLFTPRKRYEVLIDENTSFTEIYGKYEVIQQRGDIYILEDINYDDNFCSECGADMRGE